MMDFHFGIKYIMDTYMIYDQIFTVHTHTHTRTHGTLIFYIYELSKVNILSITIFGGSRINILTIILASYPK